MARHWSGSLRPVHMPQAEQEQTRERVVRQIHEGALELVSTASRTFGKWMVSLDIEPNKTLRVLDRYFENPHPRDARILSGVVFEDAYGGKSMKTILPAPDRLRDECVWLRGREAMIRAETCTEEKKLPSGRRRAARRDPGNLGRVIHWYLLKTLDDRKKRKLLRDPGLFFYDAKNPFTRKVIGGIYLKSIRET
ncbi:hypothetical protein D3C71_1585260 [compost metagenome]